MTRAGVQGIAGKRLSHSNGSGMPADAHRIRIEYA